MYHRSPQSYRNLGKRYEETDKTAEAYRVFREGKAQYPENEGLVFDELDFYLKNANPAEALDRIEAALKFDPDNPTIWYSLVVANLKAGSIGQAETDLASEDEVKPDYDKDYYNN